MEVGVGGINFGPNPTGNNTNTNTNTTGSPSPPQQQQQQHGITNKSFPIPMHVQELILHYI